MIDYSTTSNIEIIAQLIIDEADSKTRKDRVADIYSTLREVCLVVSNKMIEVRLKEKDKCLKKN